MGRRGKKQTAEIIELFIEFLYCAKGMSYDDIKDLTQVPKSTIFVIAKRRGFAGKRAEPQDIDDTLAVIDSTFKASTVAVNQYMVNDISIDDVNVHQHITSQKNMIDVRRGVVETSTYKGLKAAIEAFKDVYKWMKSTDALTQEQKDVGNMILTTYQESKASEAIDFLKSVSK